MGSTTSYRLRVAFQLRAARVSIQVHCLQRKAGQGKERDDVKVRLFEDWADARLHGSSMALCLSSAVLFAARDVMGVTAID